MKRMVMFSITMLVVSSTAFAGFASDANEAKQAQNRDGNVSGKTQNQYGQGGAGQRHENQGGGYNGGGVQHAVPGQNGGGIQPIPASSLTPAMTTVADLYMILANAHHAKAIAVAELALANSSTRMKKVKMAETKIDMELQKLHEARKMLPMVKTSAARTNLTPAQAEVVHNARMNLRPAISNLRPAISNPDMLCVCDGSMTGGGNATNTPGFTGGNGNATDAPGSMTGGTGHGSTQQQGNIGQGDAGRYNYQTMNPAQSNVTNSARSQMTPARARN